MGSLRVLREAPGYSPIMIWPRSHEMALNSEGENRRVCTLDSTNTVIKYREIRKLEPEFKSKTVFKVSWSWLYSH